MARDPKVFDKGANATRNAILSYFAVAQSKRGPGAPTKLERSLKKAAMGGEPEILEFIRLFNAAKNRIKRRPVGRPLTPKSWTDQDYKLWLALVEAQRTSMISGGKQATVLKAITRLVDIWAFKGGMSRHNARKRLPYFNPHSFRNTLVRFGEVVCKSPEDFKAWSQNLGHDKVLTTFISYGQVASSRQGEIIRGLATPQQVMQSDANEIAEAVFKKLRASGVDIKVR